MMNYTSGSTSGSGSSGSSSSSSSPVNPQAKEALNRFKHEVAGSLNINLKQGYNGDLTTKEAGSIGGEMVKRMIAYAEQNMAGR